MKKVLCVMFAGFMALSIASCSKSGGERFCEKYVDCFCDGVPLCLENTLEDTCKSTYNREDTFKKCDGCYEAADAYLGCWADNLTCENHTPELVSSLEKCSKELEEYNKKCEKCN